MQERVSETQTVQPLRQRIVVLPLQPASGAPFDGMGLAIHFLLGNVLALHTGLEEFWFGWRAQKIFTEREGLRAYCRNTAPPLDIAQIARQQDVRYWLRGQVGQGAEPTVRLQLTDADGSMQRWDNGFAVAPGGRLVAFRREFLEWLGACGLPLPQEQAAKTLWHEESDAEGMRCMGEALETVYCNGYQADPSDIDVRPFQQAVATAPESYLALDLLGWAWFRRLDYAAARAAFAGALEKNPHGAGVLSGLLRCAIETGDETDAYRWAEAIASLRGVDLEAQKAAAAHLLAKRARSRGDDQAAAALYRKATAWDPAKKLYSDGLAAVLSVSGSSG